MLYIGLTDYHKLGWLITINWTGWLP